ncbi:MAG TPA: GDSL-type esterase/lipase family protein [Marmoricola sp.]|nr:GDSL-type esterase/lipase family protein [Marmoricola sp.]
MTLRLAVLGDSIAAGHGAGQPQDTIARRLVRRLRRQGLDARSRVFALSGARSSGLAQQVELALTWQPHLAVIVVGANDVTNQTPPREAARHLAEAVRRLREVGAEVVVAPAPDLSMVPHVPAFLRPAVRAASARLRTAQVEAATAAGAAIADGDGRTSEAFNSDRRLFSADRFHPSSAGYAVITRELWPHVQAAAETATARGAA